MHGFLVLACLGAGAECGGVKSVRADELQLRIAHVEPNQVFHFILNFEDPPTRALCAVESCLRALAGDGRSLPVQSSVMVLVWNAGLSVLRHCELLEELARFSTNVTSRVIEFLVVDFVFADLVVSTPLEPLYAGGRNLGKFDRFNRVNALRLVICAKFSGCYADTDVLFVADPSHLGDFVSLQTRVWEPWVPLINSAPFAFRKRYHPFLLRMMENFVGHYDGDTWGEQGPHLWSRVFSQHCGLEAASPSAWCRHISFLPASRVSAISWNVSWKFLLPKLQFTRRMWKSVMQRDPLFVHFWDHFLAAKESTLIAGTTYKHTLLGRLRRTFCPAVHRRMVQEIRMAAKLNATPLPHGRPAPVHSRSSPEGPHLRIS